MVAIVTLSLLAILVLYLGLFKATRAILPVSLLGLGAVLVLGLLEWSGQAAPLFHGMVLFDHFSIVFSTVCVALTALIFVLLRDYFDRSNKNVGEYYALLMFSLVGAMLITSYHHLVMLFMGVEIMSVALYVLVGIRKKDFSSNEAALKYFLMGAFSTGFLVFGMALLYGASGSFDLSEIRAYLVDNPQSVSPLFYGGILLLLVGLAFKVGVAPFHFWTPDVYEGAPVLITTFMSTVVKTAGFAAFLRIFLYCFTPLQEFWVPVLLVMAILTLFIGNISAVAQQSVKRMLAYSSISHAGYMLFAILAIGENSASAVLLYATAYSIASVIAFGSIVLVKRSAGSEHYEAFNGLVKRNPFLALTITIAMLSLAGIPLTAGFVGKFLMFSAALSDYHVLLVMLAVINAAIGIYYYFRVIVAMYFKPADRDVVAFPMHYKVVFAVGAAITVVLGVYPDILLRWL